MRHTVIIPSDDHRSVHLPGASHLKERPLPRGLVFNEDKTRIVHLTTGFDFLGFSVRRYGATLLIKP